MKILFLARRFYPDIGGVEKHVLEISKQLVYLGHDITVICEQSSDQKYKTKNIHAISVIRFSSGKNNWFKKFRIWKQLWRLRKIIKEADVIHCHDVFFWYLPFRFLYPFKKVFTTFHGYEGYPIKNKAILIRKISEKLSWGNICIGDFIKKWYRTKPTFVSYGAVDLASLRGKTTKQSQARLPRFARNDNKESAVFIGRLDEQTGIFTYVKAFEILKKKLPKFELVVVGDGKYRKLIEKTVKVLGFQKNPEKYFSDCRFAFVSRYLSILEAFAAKKLVFAVYDNQIKEDYLKVSPFASWIVIVKDEGALTEKIKYFLNHPEEETKLVNKAYDWVKNQTWEKITSLYLALWSQQSS